MTILSSFKECFVRTSRHLIWQLKYADFAHWCYLLFFWNMQGFVCRILNNKLVFTRGHFYVLPFMRKGQLTSKGLFGILNSSKKQTKKFGYHVVSGWVVFVHFLEEIDNTNNTFRKNLTSSKVNKFRIFFQFWPSENIWTLKKKSFEINWPLAVFKWRRMCKKI